MTYARALRGEGVRPHIFFDFLTVYLALGIEGCSPFSDIRHMENERIYKRGLAEREGIDIVRSRTRPHSNTYVDYTACVRLAGIF